MQGATLAVAGWTTTSDTDWTKLRNRLGSRLVLPQDQGYDQLRLPYSEIYAHRRPAAIARCVKPEDVQACLDFASHHRIPVVARSGRHL